MKIVTTLPPLVDEILLVFPTAKPARAFFTWGDTIHNPWGAKVLASHIAHEQVHANRQGSDPESWWRRYLIDPQFRLDEELPAHQAEYRWHCLQPGSDRPVTGWRSRRAFCLHHIAGRLSGPLYGGLISYPHAKQAIAAGAVGL